VVLPYAYGLSVAPPSRASAGNSNVEAQVSTRAPDLAACVASLTPEEGDDLRAEVAFDALGAAQDIRLAGTLATPELERCVASLLRGLHGAEGATVRVPFVVAFGDPRQRRSVDVSVGDAAPVEEGGAASLPIEVATGDAAPVDVATGDAAPAAVASVDTAPVEVAPGGATSDPDVLLAALVEAWWPEPASAQAGSDLQRARDRVGPEAQRRAAELEASLRSMAPARVTRLETSDTAASCGAAQGSCELNGWRALADLDRPAKEAARSFERACQAGDAPSCDISLALASAGEALHWGSAGSFFAHACLAGHGRACTALRQGGVRDWGATMMGVCRAALDRDGPVSVADTYACSQTVAAGQHIQIAGNQLRAAGAGSMGAGAAIVMASWIIFGAWTRGSNPEPAQWGMAGIGSGVGVLTAGAGAVLYLVGISRAEAVAERFPSVPQTAPPRPDHSSRGVRAAGPPQVSAASTNLTLGFPF
jgi:hypothetical protein